MENEKLSITDVETITVFGTKYKTLSQGKIIVFDTDIYVKKTDGKGLNIQVQNRVKSALSTRLGSELPRPTKMNFGDIVLGFWLLNQKYRLNASQIAKEIQLNENTVSNYLNLAKKLKKDQAEIVKEVERQPNQYSASYEKFLDDPLVKKWMLKLARPKNKSQRAELKQSPPKVHKLLMKVNDGFGASPSQFLLVNSGLEADEKLDRIKEMLRPVRDQVHEKAEKKAQENNEKYKGTAWYTNAKAIRGFIRLGGGLDVPDQDIDSVLSQDIKEFAGKYKQLQAEPEQIEKLKECLKRDNKDAYFMFLLSLEIGFRAMEAFTISTKSPDDRESGIIKKTWKGKTRYQIQILTRKSAWVNQYTHKVLILDDKTTELIHDRLEEIKNGIGIIKRKDINGKMVDMKDHSLLGFDDDYVQINTIQYPKPTITEKQAKNQLKLLNVFRQSYIEAGLDDSYYTKKPFHSMRHIFAQYWLNKTSYDYQFVADLGHWKTLSVLKDSYGGMPEQLFFQKQALYHDREHKSMSEQANEKITPEELEAIKETYEENIELSK